MPFYLFWRCQLPIHSAQVKSCLCFICSYVALLWRSIEITAPAHSTGGCTSAVLLNIASLTLIEREYFDCLHCVSGANFGRLQTSFSFLTSWKLFWTTESLSNKLGSYFWISRLCSSCVCVLGLESYQLSSASWLTVRWIILFTCLILLFNLFNLFCYRGPCVVDATSLFTLSFS